MNETTSEKYIPKPNDFNPVETLVADSFEERMRRRSEREALEATKKPNPAASAMEIGFRWRRPEEAVDLRSDTLVLFKTVRGMIVSGILYADGVLGFLDIKTMTFLEQSTWTNILGWFPQSELPK